MDKSEGTDFFSKTFSKFTERVAQWYHSSQKRVSIATLKRAKNEKLLSLGLKTFELITANSPVTLDALREDFEAVTRLNKDIAKEEGELNTINGYSAERSSTFTGREAEDTPPAEGAGKTSRRRRRKSKQASENKPQEASGAKKRGRPKKNPLAVEDKSGEKADPRLLPMTRENGSEE